MGKSDLGAGYRHRILHAAAMFDRDEVFDAFLSFGGNRRDQLERLCPSRHGGKPGAWRSPCAHKRHCQPRLSSQGATPPIRACRRRNSPLCSDGRHRNGDRRSRHWYKSADRRDLEPCQIAGRPRISCLGLARVICDPVVRWFSRRLTSHFAKPKHGPLGRPGARQLKETFLKGTILAGDRGAFLCSVTLAASKRILRAAQVALIDGGHASRGSALAVMPSQAV